MKKFMTIALVALLAVSSVFAGFTGKIDTQFGAWLDAEEYGFKNGKASFELKFGADKVAGATAAEGDVKAEFAGHVEFEGKLKKDDVYALNAKFKLDSFKVIGKDWNVNLTGAKGVSSYASDWAANDDGDVADLASAFEVKAPGVTVSVFDYAAGLGFWKDKDGTKALASVTTPNYALAEGLTLQASAAAGKAAGVKAISTAFGTQVAYANKDLKLDASVGTDVVLGIPTEKGADVAVDADVALAASYDFVSLNAYYATKANEGFAANSENYYSVGLGFDFKDLFAPVTLNVDVVNAKKATGFVNASTSATVMEGLTINANGGYDLATEGWFVGAGTSYKFDGVGTVSGRFDLSENAEKLSTKLGFSTTDVLPGATLSLDWNTTDLIADSIDDVQWGSVVAKIACKF